MMNRSVTWALGSLFIVAAVLIGARSVGAQGTVITLADGVVVPGGLGFVDLDAVNVDGFQQVSLLGVATPDPRTDVRLDVAFATDPLPYAASAPRALAASCGIADSGVRNCANGAPGTVFQVGGPFLTIRLSTSSADAAARTATLKAYLK